MGKVYGMLGGLPFLRGSFIGGATVCMYVV